MLLSWSWLFCSIYTHPEPTQHIILPACLSPQHPIGRMPILVHKLIQSLEICVDCYKFFCKECVCWIPAKFSVNQFMWYFKINWDVSGLAGEQWPRRKSNNGWTDPKKLLTNVNSLWEVNRTAGTRDILFNGLVVFKHQLKALIGIFIPQTREPLTDQLGTGERQTKLSTEAAVRLSANDQQTEGELQKGRESNGQLWAICNR